MKNIVRRIAVVVGAVAVSAGLIGASAVPATAATKASSSQIQSRSDSSWPI